MEPGAMEAVKEKNNNNTNQPIFENIEANSPNCLLIQPIRSS